MDILTNSRNHKILIFSDLLNTISTLEDTLTIFPDQYDTFDAMESVLQLQQVYQFSAIKVCPLNQTIFQK